MELLHFNSIYPLVESLYGIEADPDDFEDVALVGWQRINNKHTRLYRFVGDVKNGELQLPCNSDGIIESVHIPINDAQMTTSTDFLPGLENLFIEDYIDAWKPLNDPLYQRGKLVKYQEGNNTLYFKKNYRRVMVVYKGILADEEDGLPMITEKERDAIAAFVAYITLRKDGIKKKDKNSLELSSIVQQDWLRLCNAARIPEHLSQNDMNMILDARTRWDRKQYSKSMKPVI